MNTWVVPIKTLETHFCWFGNSVNKMSKLLRKKTKLF